MSDATALLTPRPEPLFSIDLAGNGGIFAPTTIEEVTSWLHVEIGFWSWLQNQNSGNHDQVLKQGWAQLNHGVNQAQQARQFMESNPQHYQSLLSEVGQLISAVYVQSGFPHSSTPLAMRIDAYRIEVGGPAATFFAAVFVPPTQNHHFQPQNLVDWRGLTEALIERFSLLTASQKSRKQSAEQSFEQLRLKAENLVGEKTATYDALHRDYTALAASIHSSSGEHATAFKDAQTSRVEDFDKLVSKHKTEMEGLRKTFREEIALRAPAEYWGTKRTGHDHMSKITGGISFGGIALAAVGLGLLIHDLLRTAIPGTPPETWRLALLALMSVFAVWGLRLVVRMFLSHLHLSTDASERVVMVRTYLSLLEGDQLASTEDRQLILQALFCPATDGIVKDEGIPFSLAELLTRQGK